MNVPAVVVFILFATISKIDGRCINILNEDEEACAVPLGLDASSVYDFYTQNSDNQKFGNYLECVWSKWNWMDSDGTILFDNIKQSPSLAWRISRICNDIGQIIELRQKDFQKSAAYCEQNRPEILNPLTVRKCIAENFKPTPFKFD